MTTAGPPVQLGGIEVGAPVRLGGTQAGSPVVVPGGGGGGSGGPYAAKIPVDAPQLLVQAVHHLSWRPAGVLCIDTLDQITEPDTISYPSAGITEITFGVPFTGTVYLS